MKVLALDTAQNACAVAVTEDGRTLARRFAAMERGHAEALMPMVLGAAAEAGVRLDAVDLFAATRGPGAFTGIRIGLACVRGLALAAAKPAWGVGTIAAVARAVDPARLSGRVLLVALETKRADVYAQAFDGALRPLGPPAATALDDLARTPFPADAPILVAGDAAERTVAAFPAAMKARSEVDAGSVAVDPAVVAALAAEEWTAAGRPASPPAPTPLYLRPPGITLADASPGR